MTKTENRFVILLDLGYALIATSKTSYIFAWVLYTYQQDLYTVIYTYQSIK